MSADLSKPKRRAAPEPAVIARAALELLDAEGLDALSMRRLAERVGVGTMTLYGSFRSKDELLEAAVGAAVAEFDFDPPDGPFRERMIALVHAVKDVLDRHPALPRLRAEQPIVQRQAFRMTEPALQILLDAGFAPDDAARAFRLLFTYVFGQILFSPGEPTEAARREVRAALALLPGDEFPAVAEAADGLAASIGGAEQFDYGLERILDGLEAQLTRGA